MRFALLTACLLTLANLAAQNEERRFAFEASFRATTLGQIIVANGDAPDLVAERARESVSTYYGLVPQLGVKFNLNERWTFGVGLEGQFYGMRGKEFDLLNGMGLPGEDIRARLVDRFFGLGVPLSAQSNLSSRFYLRTVAAPVYVINRGSRLRVKPKDARPEFSREVRDPFLEENIRNVNLSLQLGLGYRWLLRDRYGLFVELGMEYYALNTVRNAPVNRRIYGSALKVGVEL